MKKFLLLLTAAVAALSMSAADVSTMQAQAAANAFLNKQVAAGRLKASAASNLQLVKAEKSVAKPTAVDYYIFNSAQSYVVVAGDDLAPQILMYGEEGSLDINNIPPAMQWLLNKYKYQIDGLKAGTMVPLKLPKFATTPVAPLVTANWDQSAPYNNQCPSSGGRHAVTGCPATSLAMCYYKWKWPDTYPAVAALSNTGGLSAPALPEREADWDNIIDEYTGPTNYNSTAEQKDAVAWLMRYAGQAIPDYQYSTSASGANDPEIYQGCLNMGYTDAQYLLLTELVSSGWTYTNGPQQYTDEQWNEFMMNELQNGRPIEYLAYDVSGGYSVSGHAFNVFGCNADGQYYVNWGWSGDSNGYCTLHNFTTATGATGQSGSYVFNYGEAMIVGIEPPAGALTDPRIKVNPSTLTMNTIVGNPVTDTFTVTGYNLTDNIELAISGDNAFSLSTTSISAAQSENGVTVTVTYNPAAVGDNEATITLTSNGAENVMVKVNGTADLETYNPVMLEARDVTTSSFTANWTDETPAENVESYTLYVSDKPFKPAVALLDSVDWTQSSNIPANWTSYNLQYFGSNSASYLLSGGYVQSCTYDLTGYDKMTVMVYAEAYNSNNTLTVTTSVDNKNVSLGNNSPFTWYTFVVNCASSDYMKLTSSGMPDMRYVKVYAGELTPAQLKASETGDDTYRVITGITDKSYTVTGLTPGGTFNYYVEANYINGATGSSEVKQVTLFESTDPAIIAKPVSVDMEANVGETVSATFNVSGAYLVGDVALELNDADGVFSITPTTISAADAMSGMDVTVTYTPTAHGNNTATITLSSAGAENAKVTLNGTANLMKNAPVMQPADEQGIGLTKFRADWTDETPEANVSSYTLEVTPKPTLIPVELIGTLDGTVYTGSYADVTLSEPWGGQCLRGGNNAIYFRNNYDGNGLYGNITFTIPEGYYNAPYTIRITTSTSYGSGNLTVATPQTEAVGYSFSSGQTRSWLVTASAGEKITITSTDNSYSPDIARIEVYLGDATASAMLKAAVETGDENSRMITDITEKFYTVENLAAEGTFLYRVKAMYIDGTESDWSNVEEVTLFDSGHKPGDVNHDTFVNISDVSALISYILNEDGDICLDCADFNGDHVVNISDVMDMITLILNR
ncbi:MAG: C10 family peptidase [Muribaculaceae bacterium]|nr:C10 family peptidase [Muribaculaceae bacterium]